MNAKTRAVRQRFWEEVRQGRSSEEAAEVADVPVGTIMSRLARARIALQAKLDAGAGLRRSTSDVKAE